MQVPDSTFLLSFYGLTPMMLPRIAADLERLALAGRDRESLEREIIVRKRQRTRDSLSIISLQTENAQLPVLLERINAGREREAASKAMIDYWRGRYKRASTERWGWRGMAALRLWLRLRGGF